MRIRSRKSEHTTTGTVLNRNELSSILAMADALERVAPKNVVLSDEVTLSGSAFKFSWIERKGGRSLTPDVVDHVEREIISSFTECVNRRVEAREAGLEIQELPSDAKQISLNKALHEAEGKGLMLVRHEADGNEPVFAAQNPREVLLVRPPDEPLHIEADYLVSGSNVVGGPTQLPLFQEALVDVIYFLHDAPYSQVRANVPLGLAAVKNLTTRIRGEFIRTHPEDTYLTTTIQPELYLPDDVTCMAEIRSEID